MKIDLSGLTPAFEAYSTDLPEFDSPIDLLKSMGDINYGWADKNLQLHKDFGSNFSNNYRMLLPHEVHRLRVGVCWDQSVYEKYIFDTQFEFDEVVLMSNQMYYLGTHTYLCYRDGKDWFYFENSWGQHRGIHGPYKSISAVNKVVRQWQKDEHRQDLGAMFTDITRKPLYKKHSCDGFLKLMNYDFAKADHTPEVYHYVYNAKNIDKILKSGKLLPTDVLRDPGVMLEYGSRADSGKADDYFRMMYDRFYKPVLKKPYKHYGIYSTTVDLAGIDLDITHRIAIPSSLFDSSNTVIQIGAKVEPFSPKRLEEVIKKFSDKNRVAKLYHSSTLKFRKLPQVVFFGDSLPIEKRNVSEVTR